jgi:putative transposase
VTGRKRHLLVDTMGLVLAVIVHAANIQDRDGARLVFDAIRRRFARLRVIWADGGYAGELVDWARRARRWVLEIVKRDQTKHTFEVLPHRWIVERTFAWLGRYRRLSKDYEVLPETSETMIRIAMMNLMLHRLCPERKARNSGF